jgi:superfamily II DNA or RNA helicase
MPGPHLWPHQQGAIRSAVDAVGRQKSGLWAMPTGTGKTVAFSRFAWEMGFDRTLVMVHRDELVQQTLKTFGWVWPGASQGVIQGELDQWNRNVVVASVQSLHSRRLPRYDPSLYDLVIVDEAHHAAANSWGNVLDHFDAKFVLGVTATPERFDGRGLDHIFGDEPLYVYPLRQAIEDERLVRIIQYGIKTYVNLDKVKVQRGDFQTGELSAAVNTPERNKIIVDAYLEKARGRRAAAFCVDLQHVYDLAETFDGAGVSVSFVDGNMPKDERRARLAAFRAGRFDVMVNCEVLTEGFDDPGLSCILGCRPTKSRGLLTQMIGRGLRLHEGKSNCMILDFSDNCHRHKLASVFSLLGARGDIETAEGSDVLEAIDHENNRLVEQEEIADLSPLMWQSELVQPWPDIPALDGYTERFAWQEKTASAKQEKFLSAFKLGITRKLTKGEASYLIERCLEMEAKFPTPPTSKQAYYLRLHQVEPDGMTKREASEWIGFLKGGGAPQDFVEWKRKNDQDKRKKQFWAAKGGQKKRSKKVIDELGLEQNPNAGIWGVNLDKN